MPSPSNADRKPSEAFLGSPTQNYPAVNAREWKRIELGAAASPAFLGSPTQGYRTNPLRLPNAATLAAGLRRMLVRITGSRTQSAPPAQTDAARIRQTP